MVKTDFPGVLLDCIEDLKRVTKIIAESDSFPLLRYLKTAIILDTTIQTLSQTLKPEFAKDPLVSQLHKVLLVPLQDLAGSLALFLNALVRLDMYLNVTPKAFVPRVFES